MQKKIAVINDFSGFGRCSIAVSLPIISAMKIQCCPVPTAIFSNHTGFESFFCNDYTENMTDYISEWKKLNLQFDGILTGFLGSVKQIEIVKDFLEHFKGENTLAIIDPVMGDNGRLYSTYPKELADSMHSLLKYADILTPNLTEACILTKTPYNADMDEGMLYEMCEKLHSMGPEKIVISGLEKGLDLANYVFEAGQKPHFVTEHKAGPCRSGTGDVFSSIIAADAVRGIDFTQSVKHASHFIAKSLKSRYEF